MSRRYRFTGVPADGPFALNVTQYGLTATGERASWIDEDDRWGDPTPGCEAEIGVHRSTLQVAPEGTIFRVDLTGFDTPGPSDPDAYDPQWHSIYYFWDFGDPGSTFTAPEKVLPHQRDANVGYGPMVGHVFENPGDYTVRVLVIEPTSGKIAKAEYPISVADPNVLFAAHRTFFVETNRDGRSGPAGAIVFDDLADALEATRDRGYPIRVILRDGQRFPLAEKSLSEQHKVSLITGQGGTDLPTITNPTRDGHFKLLNYTGTDNQLIFNKVRGEGNWDATTETGGKRRMFISGRNDQGSYLMLHNCEISGYAFGVSNGANTNETQVRIFSNSIITNWQDYGIYDEVNAPCIYLGMRIAQHVDARSGGPKSSLPDPVYNTHGPVRLQGCDQVAMDGCDFFSRNGWFENEPSYRSQQPCLRWNQRGQRGARGNIQRCSMEGGLYVITATRINADLGAVNLHNLLVERSILVGSHMTAGFLDVEYGGTTIRNNLMIHPDVPRIGSTFNPGRFVKMRAPATTISRGNVEENRAAPIAVYGNTFASYQTNNNINPVRQEGDLEFTDVSEANNVLYAPNARNLQVSDGPFHFTALWTPREKGYVSEEHPTLLTQYATPADTVMLLQPRSGSSALGSADEDTSPIGDFFGNFRPAYPSKGAFEAAP